MLDLMLARCAQELAVSFAMAYLAFYLANSPLKVSGVTAVVVLGLYGSATGKWEMCAPAARFRSCLQNAAC